MWEGETLASAVGQRAQTQGPGPCEAGNVEVLGGREVGRSQGSEGPWVWPPPPLVMLRIPEIAVFHLIAQCFF